MLAQAKILFVCIAILWGCGGKSAGEQESAALEVLVAQFTGLRLLEKGDDNSWTLRWTPIEHKGVVYAVYSALENEEFNFNQPLVTTQEDIYKYTPENVFTESATCFVVRISNLNGDENLNKQCTTDQPFEFLGLQAIERQSDGSYLLEWDAIPVKGTIYSVYESKDGEEYNFNLPSFDAIKDNFFKTDVIDRGESHCFIIRYSHAELPEDDNQTELCTETEEPIVFSGIDNLIANSSTQITISWKKSSTAEIASYNVYQGSDFKELMGSANSASISFVVTGLVPGRQYSFGVRAVDSFGREDKNIKIRSVVMPAN